MTAKTLSGSLEEHSRTKYSNQGPGKRSLPGRPTKAPARGACREGQPRPRQEDLAGKRQGPGKRSLPGRPTTALQETCRDAPHVPARSGERQASGLDKTTTPTRYLPGASCHSIPALQRTRPRVAMRLSQGRVAGACAARGTRWQAEMKRRPSWQTVALLTVTFCTV